MPTNYDADYQKSVAIKAARARVEALKARLSEQEAPKPTQTAPAEAPAEKKEEGGFLDSVGAFIKELPEQFVGGVNDAINNTVEAARDAGKALGIPNYALQYKNEKGEWDWKFLNEKEVEEKGGLDKVLPEFEQASTAGGQMLRALTTFATGFIPAAKGVKAIGAAAKIGKVGAGMVAGGIADAVVTDPHQERLATFLNEVPALGAIIPDYIADNDPANEGNWEGRIKNVIEGAVLGGASEAIVGSAVKLFKGYKVASLAKKAAGETGALSPEDAVKQMDEMAAAKKAAAEEFAATEEELASKSFTKETPEELAAKAASAKKEGKVYINMDRINTEDDVKKMMQEAADMNADTINKGGKTFEGIQAASEEEMKDVNSLLSRPTKRPFTAEEAVAARTILTSSADNLTKLGQIASMPNASTVDLFNFKKAMALHNDIQVKVFAGRKATAQSLVSWRISAKSDAGRLKAIQAAMAEGSVDAQKMAKIIATVDPSQVSKVAGDLMSQKWADAHYQVWINGLLSSPSTHAANAISNIGTTLMSIPERYVTAGFEKMMGANSSAFVEANARATGLYAGIKDGISLMAGKTENLKLRSSKFEKEVDAISSIAWGKQPESVMGKGLDYLGKAIGMPGWALEKSDNFFKGLNYRMMLNEKAARTAAEEGLTGKAFKMRMSDLVNNPTEAMENVSADFAKYQTFTNEAGAFTKGVQKAINATPGGKYVMPFVRTPSNIIAYGFERTPLAPLMGSVRAELKAGGSRAAAATAKMAAGSTLMAGASALALDGKITGGGPANFDERRALEATGWQPYSVKVGDKYISYERLEPIGSLIAYSADITSIMGQKESDENEELVAAGLAAFARNLGNKTFLSGVAQFVDVMNSGDPNKIERWAQRLGAGMVQPVYSSATKKTNAYFDDVKRDYRPEEGEGFLKSVFKLAQENVPGMGVDAPPLRDVWGEIQTYSDGIASPIDVMSPIKLGDDKNDPVSMMIAENRIPLSRPERTIKGVKLTNKQYSEYCEIAGKEAKKALDDAHASGLFDGMSEGPDGEIALVIKKILSGTRRHAQGKMIMDDPELEDAIYQTKLEQESKLLGE